MKKKSTEAIFESLIEHVKNIIESDVESKNAMMALRKTEKDIGYTTMKKSHLTDTNFRYLTNRVTKFKSMYMVSIKLLLKYKAWT